MKKAATVASMGGMSLRNHIQALVEELQEWRRQGRDFVEVPDETLQALRAAVREQVAGAVAGRPEAGPVEKRAGGRTEDAGLPDWKPGRAAEPVHKKAAAKSRKAPTRAPLPEHPPKVELPEGDKHVRWEALRKQVVEGPVCRSQVSEGKKVVFGVGSLEAELFFVGEGPGADEETEGEPFVGAAGKTLNGIIGGMGMQREEVYIGNVMNWRPLTDTGFGNRPPTAEEINICWPFLQAQIEIVQPRVLVALGGTAANGLLGYDPKRRMGAVRGRWFTYGDIPVMVTFHPSYLLHNDSKRVKRMVWEDFLQVMEKLGRPISDKQRGYFL